MDAEYTSFYTKGVMAVLIREFKSPDEEMKKIVLKVVKQCASTEGVQADYIRSQCVISTQCLDPDCIRSHTVLS